MANCEPRYMISYFYGGSSVEDAGRACIETAKLNNCTVFMDFNGVYVPVTRCMNLNTVYALYHLLLGWHPEEEPEKAVAK